MGVSVVVAGILEQVFARMPTMDDGVVADYIPQFAGADPAACGIALASLDGEVAGAGGQLAT